MAGHIQDRWYKTEPGPDGKEIRVKTDRYGKGMRYRARYISPDGTEKSKSFPDRQKRQAEDWLTNIEADMSRGQYIDPRAGNMTFQTYAKDWLDAQTSDLASRIVHERRLRLHTFPHLGSRPLVSIQPSHIRAWLATLERAGLADNYRRAIFDTASLVLGAAVDDGRISRNPCRTSSVRRPKLPPSRVKPWSSERLFAVQDALSPRYRALVDVGGGLGLRQGEIFGLAVDEVDEGAQMVHVVQQVKEVGSRLIFAPPKGGKFRDVPLPDSVAVALAEHAKAFPPVEVTLPWGRPDGPEVTRRLYFTTRFGNPLRHQTFEGIWKPALVAAEVIPPPEQPGKFARAPEDGMHALRHHYASVLLDAGENIKALSAYLGHSDPGFTLRVYTHLMPTSESRTRGAVDEAYRKAGRYRDGPETAQTA